MDDIPTRKADHIDIASERQVSATVGPGWDDVHLIHQSLPEIDLADVDLSVELLGRPLRAPLIIASMTGGHERAEEINRRLARAAQEFGLGMGVGSQRAAIRHPQLLRTYTVTRDEAPDALLIANIGAPQLIDQVGEAALTFQQVIELIDAMRADVLAVHLNYLQEVVQPEGDTRARGCLEAIRRLCGALSVPVITKETGAGISRQQAMLLRDAGVAGLDVGGAGGTSFALVEAVRARDRGMGESARLGEMLGDWGLPTAVSVVECTDLGPTVLATGGVRSGLDAAKALALGAGAVGVARPMLTAALQGYDALRDYVSEFIEGLRVVLFLTGARTISDLRSRPRVVTGRTAEWLNALGASERRGP